MSAKPFDAYLLNIKRIKLRWLMKPYALADAACFIGRCSRMHFCQHLIDILAELFNGKF